MRLLDAREALVQTLEREAQLLVVDTELMQDRRVQVADLHGIAHDVVAELVGLPVGDAALDAAARQPGRETARGGITAVVIAWSVPVSSSVRVSVTSKIPPVI